MDVTSGVPQGSNLGPLLFLLFINDIPNSTPIFKFTLFADDSTLSMPFSKHLLDSIPHLINNELDKVYKWLCFNKLDYNADKTKFMIFSYKTIVKFPVENSIIFGSHTLKCTTHLKFLGIVIDNNLSFTHHIDYLSKKVSKSIGILYKINKSLPTDILKSIYISLIQPYFIYAIEAWYGTTQSNIN